MPANGIGDDGDPLVGESEREHLLEDETQTVGPRGIRHVAARNGREHDLGGIHSGPFTVVRALDGDAACRNVSLSDVLVEDQPTRHSLQGKDTIEGVHVGSSPMRFRQRL